MNARKAKALRKMAESIGKVETIYQATNHREKPFIIGFNADGTPKHAHITTFTVEMGDCNRRTYKLLKKVG